MLASILKQSFSNQKGAMALMMASVSVGTALIASLAAISLDVKSKVSRELRTFGANITVEPKVSAIAGVSGQKRYLNARDIEKVLTIFWRHNILGIQARLDSEVDIKTGTGQATAGAIGLWFEKDIPMPGEKELFKAGIATVSPWWEIKGRAPGTGEAAFGVSLAERLGLDIGDSAEIGGNEYSISALVSSGGKEDESILFDLPELQAFAGLQDAVSQINISALTTPMDEFAYKDPGEMGVKEYEKWYCTAYVTSIAKQIEDVVKGSTAKPIWRVAQSEGRVLGRLMALVYLLSAAVLVAASLGMSSTMAASLLKRFEEIGLMKSIGADSYDITAVFLSEAAIIGLSGGILGYFISLSITGYIGREVFGAVISARWFVLLPLSLAVSLAIASVSSIVPIRRALAVKPIVVLKGGA